MRISILVALFSFSIMGFAQSQTFKPAMQGIASGQDEGLPGGFDIQFITNGPLGRDWIYGSYRDENSLTRNVAYREGGRWVPLPFSGYYGNYATDIEMYEDTLYIAGSFGNVVLDKDSSILPNTGILKYFNDSIWAAEPYVFPYVMSSKGDSLLIWGGYLNPQDSSIIYPHVITTDKGQTWQYPYTIKHPTDTTFGGNNAPFGPNAKLEILANGDILTINNGSYHSSFMGVCRWDGLQWHAYGNGIPSNDKVLDFEFYRGELHVGGTFACHLTLGGDTVGHYPGNPGNAIARWDGSQWHELGNGILEGGVFDLFVHDSTLYAFISGGYWEDHVFGDAHIPFFAGWDGQQWCGTPTNYQNIAGPWSIGMVNDTLFATFKDVRYSNGTVDGTPIDYIMYFDGDYLHGPNSICSTPGLGEEEIVFTNDEVKTYPNPVQDELRISLPEDISQGSYELMTLDGKLVKEGKLKAGENTLTVNEKLNGVFLLKLSSSGGEIVSKVVFEN